MFSSNDFTYFDVIINKILFLENLNFSQLHNILLLFVILTILLFWMTDYSYFVIIDMMAVHDYLLLHF